MENATVPREDRTVPNIGMEVEANQEEEHTSRFNASCSSDYKVSLIPSGPSPQEEKCKLLKGVFANMNIKRAQGQFSDCTIRVGRTDFPVHKMVLASQSSYFEVMFEGNFEESSRGIVELKDTNERVFATILDFMYGQDITLNHNNIEEIINHADMFLMDPLLHCCKLYFGKLWSRFTPQKATAIAERLNLTGIQEVIKRAVKFFSLFPSESSISDYLNVSPTFIRGVKTQYNSETVCVRNTVFELSSFYALLDWLKNNIYERIDDALDLMTLYRFELMPSLTVNNYISKRFEFDNATKDLLLLKFRTMLKLAHRDFPYIGLELITLRCFPNKLIIYIFNFDFWEWSQVEVETPQLEVEKTISKDEKIFLFGKFKCCVLDIKIKEITWLPTLPEKRYGASFCVSKDFIFMAGGSKLDVECDDYCKKNTYGNGIFKLDLADPKTWVEVGKLNVIRTNPSLYYHEGQLLILGGKEVKDSEKRVPNCNKIIVFNEEDDKICDMGHLYFSTSNAKLVQMQSSLFIFPEDLSSNYQLQILNLSTKNKDVCDTQFYFKHLIRVLDICLRKRDILVACLYKKPHENNQIFLGVVNTEDGKHASIVNGCKPIAFLHSCPDHASLGRSIEFVFVRYLE